MLEYDFTTFFATELEAYNQVENVFFVDIKLIALDCPRITSFVLLVLSNKLVIASRVDECDKNAVHRNSYVFARRERGSMGNVLLIFDKIII